MVAVRIANNKAMQTTKVRIVPKSSNFTLDFSNANDPSNVTTGDGGQVGFCLSPKTVLNAGNTGNCKIGKIGVNVRDDWIYSLNDGNSDVEWAIFIDGVDTGYVATSNGQLGTPTGYLETVLPQADSRIDANYNNGFYCANTSNDQILIRLVPNRQLTLASLNVCSIYEFNNQQYANAGYDVSNIEAVATPWSEYYDEDANEITICLAPNPDYNRAYEGGVNIYTSDVNASTLELGLEWYGEYNKIYTGEVRTSIINSDGVTMQMDIRPANSYNGDIIIVLSENITRGENYTVVCSVTAVDGYDNITGEFDIEVPEYPRPILFTANASEDGGDTYIEFGPSLGWGGSYSGITVDWGDGTIDRDVSSNITHAYSTYKEGGYKATVTGNIGCVLWLRGSALLSVDDYGTLGTLGFNHTSSEFLTSLPAEIPETITTMSFDNWTTMISQCARFNDPNVALWKIPEAVTNLDWFLTDMPIFNQDLSSWCVPNVTALPLNFGLNSPEFTADKYPNWGSCPVEGAMFTIYGRNSFYVGESNSQWVSITNAAGNNSVSKLVVTSSNPEVLEIYDVNPPNASYTVKAVGAGTATINAFVNGLYNVTMDVTIQATEEPLIVTYSGISSASLNSSAQADVLINVSDTTSSDWINDRTDVLVDWGDGTTDVTKSGNEVLHTYDADAGKCEIKVVALTSNPITSIIVSGAVDEVIQWYGADVEAMQFGNEYRNMENQLVKVPDHIWPGAKRLGSTFLNAHYFNDPNVSKWITDDIEYIDLTFGKNFDQPLITWNLAKAKSSNNNTPDTYNLFFSADRAMSQNAPRWGIWDPRYTVMYAKAAGEGSAPVTSDYVNIVGLFRPGNINDTTVTSADKVTFCVRSGLVDNVFTKYERYDLVSTNGATLDVGAWWKHANFPTDKFSATLVKNGSYPILKLENLTGEIVEILVYINGSNINSYPVTLTETNGVGSSFFMYSDRVETGYQAVLHPTPLV